MTGYFENKSVNNFEADPYLCGGDSYIKNNNEKLFKHRGLWVIELIHYLDQSICGKLEH